MLKIPSLFAAWLFWTFHTKSHNMKALVILSHSWSPFLTLTCMYENKWTFVALCKYLSHLTLHYKVWSTNISKYELLNPISWFRSNHHFCFSKIWQHFNTILLWNICHTSCQATKHSDWMPIKFYVLGPSTVGGDWFVPTISTIFYTNYL